MKYKIELDNELYVNGIIHTGTEEDIYDDEEVRKIFDDFTHRTNCYKKIGNNFVLDVDKENMIIEKEKIESEIIILKQELSSTDYQIIKCSEYQLQGLQAPYDIATLHATRQALRDRINELESKL